MGMSHRRPVQKILLGRTLFVRNLTDRVVYQGVYVGVCGGGER